MILLNMYSYRLLVYKFLSEEFVKILKLRFYALESQLSMYEEELKKVKNLTKEEYVIILRR